MTEDFRNNLKFLCAERGTVAKVCRDLEINQQQFSKYLSGRAQPAARSLRKISIYFNIMDDDLYQDHARFVPWYRDWISKAGRTRRSDPLVEAFPGDSRAARLFLGAYQVYYRSPAAPEQIVIAAAFLDLVDDIVISRTFEAPFGKEDGRRQWTRCDGKVAYHSDRLFIVDFERGAFGSFTTTILIPPHRYRNSLIFGEMIFLASHPWRYPSSSRTVWRRIPATWTAKELLRTSEAVPETSSSVSPAIRKYLLDLSSPIPPIGGSG